MSLTYTYSERNVKKYTVAQACTSAKYRLEKSNIFKMSTDSIRNRSGSEKITLEELNKIADKIVADSWRFCA